MTSSAVDDLLRAAAQLRDEASAAREGLGRPPAFHVYNPLDYAWPLHEAFVRRYGGETHREAVLVGMNPGPWGMVQTGIPFGDPVVVRDWMGLAAAVGRPPDTEAHPSRPVLGLASTRREVSGTRLYGLARDSFGGIEAFFERVWIVNYCPLAIFDAGGTNVTPPQLSADQRRTLAVPCDQHLGGVVNILRPSVVIGIGLYAFGRVQAVLDSLPGAVRPASAQLLHPSPASPRANKGWAEEALAELRAAGVHPSALGTGPAGRHPSGAGTGPAGAGGKRS